MNAVIYYTKVPEQYRKKNMEHMIGEKLLERGLKEEYGLTLAFEPRATGEHGKPFFTLRPTIHYNISHSGEYVACIFAGREVGLDIQEHRVVNYERILQRTVPPEMIPEILEAGDPVKAFYTQWVLREAYIKWTGEGLSRDLRTIPVGESRGELWEDRSSDSSGTTVPSGEGSGRQGSLSEGWHTLLDFQEGYSCAVWAALPLEIRWEYAETELP